MRSRLPNTVPSLSWAKGPPRRISVYVERPSRGNSDRGTVAMAAVVSTLSGAERRASASEGDSTKAAPTMSARPDWYALAAAAFSINYTLQKSRSEEHTSELQSQSNLVCRLLLEKKKKKKH